ncbi:NYN domain-containing protein [[Clostridium] scindens]|uniref:NYN domain-containing protein n=1 Tax=Clostridium scindens (strain JCM 10418 / VPI 12708) TaxID=29347 RepID=UPI003AB9151F
MKKKIVLGILAHVDAGKTTLSEGMLYLSGSLRKLGRVDHGNAFLDTFELERERGITIFSKQVVFQAGDIEITLLDTPGHVDFSAEMERTLPVLDYALLLISGSDGIQGHTETLWRLLDRYKIPTFLFINKMDQEGTDRDSLMKQINARFGGECIDFGQEGAQQDFYEQVALCDEKTLEHYLADGHLETKAIARLIEERKVFPCYFGSALKLSGVEELLEGLATFTTAKKYPDEFGAKVYKIARDSQGSRLTYLKITGGRLKVKDVIGESKVDQIRIYSGNKHELAQEAEAGMVCAVTGLDTTYPGQGLGIEKASDMPVLEPVLTYRIVLPEDADVQASLRNFKLLEEEEPQLHIVWNERLGEIHAKLMGEVQIDVLKRLIWDRFGMAVQFDTGSIVYKETIGYPVEGVGHFEPLRHYAEVHLLLEPLEEGSGLVFASEVSVDQLDGNWQRLILTHLEEKEHLGVLTGSAITDMKITLIAGKAHQKHTEGGDFRQAVYRAVRQGLKKAQSILLEPYYTFRLEVPTENVGRAMADIQRMNGRFEPPVKEGDMSVLSGSAPVAAMRDYQTEVISYTRGRGRLFCMLKGYSPCANAKEVIEAIGYDSESDLDNPTGSVFCAHGAGYVARWDQVEELMHEDSGWKPQGEKQRQEAAVSAPHTAGQESRDIIGDEKELKEIFERTYGPIRRKSAPQRRKIAASPEGYHSGQSTGRKKKAEDEEAYLLVDGYNIIFAWEELKQLAEDNIMSARDRLMDILSDYQGFRKMTLILVFDAYKVEGNPGTIFKYHNIYVVYTKEAETADQYIEKTVHKIGRRHHVTVATSDALEQVIILGQGGHRISAQGLQNEILLAKQELREEHLEKTSKGKRYLFDGASDEMTEYVDRMRNEDTLE